MCVYQFLYIRQLSEVPLHRSLHRKPSNALKTVCIDRGTRMKCMIVVCIEADLLRLHCKCVNIDYVDMLWMWILVRNGILLRSIVLKKSDYLRLN